MEVLLGFLALALFASGPIGFLIALSLRGRIRELEERLRRAEFDLRHAAPRSEPHVSETASAPPISATPARGPTAPEIHAKEPVSTHEPSLVSSATIEDGWSTTAPSPRHVPSTVDADHAVPPTPPRSEKPEKKVEDWEQFVGGSLLNRIGVALLVLGIAFALGYTFNQLDAGGKSLLATTVSLVLIVGGCLLERKERFAYQARGLIAGGWAALYVTVYAMHGLDATRVIDDVRIAFGLLLVVGGGMIVHSLRYSQQSVTAIAYSLAYAAIVVHSIHAYTLVASIVLGAGTLFHLLRRGWRGIALLGLAASYGSILLWYQRQVFIHPEALRIALSAIGVNWLVFLVADTRAKETRNDLGILGAWSNAAAGVLLATLVFVRSNEEGRYLPAFIAGIGYVATSIAGIRRGWSVASSTHPILAAAALGYAAWLRLDLAGASWVWLAEAELAYLIGLRRGDSRLRTFGAIAFLAPLLGLARDQLPLRARYEIWDFPGAFDFGTLLFTLTAWACFRFTALCEGTIARDSGRSDSGALSTTPLATTLSHASTLLVVIALYVQVPFWIFAPVIAALALVHYELGRFLSRIELVDSSRWVAATSCFFGMYAAFDLPGRPPVLGLDSNVLSALLFATPIYLLCARSKPGRESEYGMPIGRHVFAWFATFTCFLMIGNEAPESMRGIYCAGLGLVLITCSARSESSPLRPPSYFLAGCAIIALLGFSTTSVATWRELPVAVTTTLPALVMLGGSWWIARRIGAAAIATSGEPGNEFCGRAIGYGIVGTIYSLLANRLSGDDALLTLPLFVIGLHALGIWLRDADFRIMSRIAAVMLLAATAFQDELRLSELLGVSGITALIGSGVTALIVVGLLERRFAIDSARPDRRALALESSLARIPDLSFLLAVAITVIHVGRTREGFGLSVGWALEGLIATIAGFALKARGLRVGGLLVLALALFVTLWRAFTTFDTIGRIISFLVLGGVLVLLSLAYARRRDVEPRAPTSRKPDADRDAA